MPRFRRTTLWQFNRSGRRCAFIASPYGTPGSGASGNEASSRDEDELVNRDVEQRRRQRTWSEPNRVRANADDGDRDANNCESLSQPAHTLSLCDGVSVEVREDEVTART